MFNLNNLLTNRFLAWTNNVNIKTELVERGTVRVALPDQTWKTVHLEEELEKTKFISSNQNEALEAFHHFTLKYGFGTPNPQNRVGKPTKRFSSKNDEFLVGIRHNEFRQSHNCEDAKFAKYKNILINRCNKFWLFNSYICQAYGIEFEDLKQYAMCWLVNFCGMYEDQTDEKAQDNYKLLQNYLKQRFAELQKILHKKNRSISVSKPDYEEVYLNDSNDMARLLNDFKDLSPHEALVRIETVLQTEELDRETKQLAKEWLETLKTQSV